MFNMNSKSSRLVLIMTGWWVSVHRPGVLIINKAVIVIYDICIVCKRFESLLGGFEG
jgi:hypothetical protein